MTFKFSIALDCMGGDKAPEIVLKGANIVARENNDIFFNLYGKQQDIEILIKECQYLVNKYKIIHTDKFISSEERASVALRKAKDSSMKLAIDSIKEGESMAAVSAGNTGALMAISKLSLRSIDSINRPAIVTSIPNIKKSATVMLDMGANIECKADELYQFAIMGYLYAKIILNIENPTIGILNVGSEDVKGNDNVQNASKLLKDSFLSKNFYGYVEGDDITKGTVDVVVTDGFTGNICLKSIEGTSKLITTILKESFTSSLCSKLGYLLASSSIKKSTKTVDPRMHNGAMLIGLNGVVVKSHGGTDEIGFANAIKVAISLLSNNINANITKELTKNNLVSFTLNKNEE